MVELLSKYSGILCAIPHYDVSVTMYMQNFPFYNQWVIPRLDWHYVGLYKPLKYRAKHLPHAERGKLSHFYNAPYTKLSIYFLLAINFAGMWHSTVKNWEGEYHTSNTCMGGG